MTTIKGISYLETVFLKENQFLFNPSPNNNNLWIINYDIAQERLIKDRSYQLPIIHEVPFSIYIKYGLQQKVLNINKLIIDELEFFNIPYRQYSFDFNLSYRYIITNLNDYIYFSEAIKRKSKTRKVFLPSFCFDLIITKNQITSENDLNDTSTYFKIKNIPRNFVEKVFTIGNLLFIYYFYKNKIKIYPTCIYAYNKDDNSLNLYKHLNIFGYFDELDKLDDNKKIGIEIVKLYYITNIVEEDYQRKYQSYNLNEKNNLELEIQIETVTLKGHSKYIGIGQFLVQPSSSKRFYTIFCEDYAIRSDEISTYPSSKNDFYVNEDINYIYEKSFMLFPSYAEFSTSICSTYYLTGFDRYLFDFGGRILYTFSTNEVIIGILVHPYTSEVFILTNNTSSKTVEIYKANIERFIFPFCNIGSIRHLITINEMQCTGEIKYVKYDDEEFLIICGYRCSSSRSCHIFFIYQINNNSIKIKQYSGTGEYVKSLNVNKKYQFFWQKEWYHTDHILIDLNSFSYYSINYQNVNFSYTKYTEWISPSNVFYIPEKNLIVAIGKSIDSAFPCFATYTIEIDDNNKRFTLDYKHKVYNKYYFSGALLKNNEDYFIIGIEPHKIDIYDLNCELKTTMNLNDSTYFQCVTFKNNKILLVGTKKIKLLQYQPESSTLNILQEIDLNRIQNRLKNIEIELYTPRILFYYEHMFPVIDTESKIIYLINKDRHIIGFVYE